MKTDKYINEFIEKEKQVEVNPFIATRVMTQIENPVKAKASWLQKAVISLSLAAVVAMGIGLGSLYQIPERENVAQNINDTHIENLAYYNSENHE